VEGLVSKVSYLGPITSVFNGDGPRPQTLSGFDYRRGETLLTHGWGTRAYVNNMFSVKPMKGDQLYLSIGKYTRDALLQVGVSAGWGSSQFASYDRKRGYDSMSSGWITTPTHTSDGDSFVQVRGWSSRDGQQWLGKTSPLETMKPAVQDRFYAEQEYRAAVDYRLYDYDDTTGMFTVVNLAERDGVQETLAQMPDLVIENYLASNKTFPVGNVKEIENMESSPINILNAHYDHEHLARQPLIEIYLNF
jgi:hypothetical protein